MLVVELVDNVEAGIDTAAVTKNVVVVVGRSGVPEMDSIPSRRAMTVVELVVVTHGGDDDENVTPRKSCRGNHPPTPLLWSLL